MDIFQKEQPEPPLPRLIRNLGSPERLMHLYSQAHPRHFCVAGELRGRISGLDFGEALKQVQQRHPHLSLAIENGPDGPGLVASTHPIPLHLGIADAVDAWQRQVETELSRLLPAAPGPLVRAAMLNDAADRERWVVVVTFHHAIADGLSAVAFLNDLVSAINGTPLPSLPQRPPVEALMGQADETGLADSGDGLMPVPDRDVLEDIAGRPLWRAFAGDLPQVRTCRLSAEDTAWMISECRSQGTTMQGALCAALVLANAENHGKESYSIASPINIRDAAHVDRAEIGVYLSVAVVRFRLKGNLRFWTLARHLTDTLAASRSHAGAVLALQQLEKALPHTATVEMACGFFAAMDCDAVISNLGTLDVRPEDECDGRKVRMTSVWGPMVLNRIRNERMIGAATTFGRLHLTETTPHHMQSTIGRMKTLLLAACGLPVEPAR